MNTLSRNVKFHSFTVAGTQTSDIPMVAMNNQTTSGLSTLILTTTSTSETGVQTPFWWSYNHGDNASEHKPESFRRQRKKRGSSSNKNSLTSERNKEHSSSGTKAVAVAPLDLGLNLPEKLRTEGNNRPKNQRKFPEPKRRPEVLIVKAGNLSYSEMLRKIKAGTEVQALGNNISSVNEKRGGHLRVVLDKKATGAEDLSRAISSAVGNSSTCIRHSHTSRIEIKDVDAEATDDEIVQAISKVSSPAINVKILSKRKVGRGTQIVTVSIPASIAKKLLSDRLRIGYVNCRVRCIIEVKKCFRCQDYGSSRDNCKASDRSNLCWKCGSEGHKSRECSSEAKCFLCKDEVSNEHVLGSYKCHNFRRALEAEKIIRI